MLCNGQIKRIRNGMMGWVGDVACAFSVFASPGKEGGGDVTGRGRVW